MPRAATFTATGDLTASANTVIYTASNGVKLKLRLRNANGSGTARTVFVAIDPTGANTARTLAQFLLLDGEATPPIEVELANGDALQAWQGTGTDCDYVIHGFSALFA